MAWCMLLSIIELGNLVLTSAWPVNGSLNGTSCYMDRGGFFPCSDTITGNLFLMLFYGGILGVAAKMISDGAELLLELGFSPSIIGGVVLPILGAVPDSAMIVASGIGDDAQEKLSVGMGTLAGSTVMLLTVAWAASLAFSKCDINSQGVSIDQTGKGKFSFTKQGITPLPEIKSSVIIMLLTSLFYFIIQSADWHWGATKTQNQPAYVRYSALATFILCLIGLVLYIVHSIFDNKRTDRIAKLRKEEVVKRIVLHRLILMAHQQTFHPSSPNSDQTDAAPNEDGHAVSKKYFKAWHMKKGMKKFSEEDQEPLVETEQSNIKKEVDGDKERSKLKLAIKCAVMLIAGVAFVTIFSDPMCDVLTSLTNKKNKSYIPIPSFYVSFVVTPFCSNASELVSSLIFASKKTQETATMTFSQLIGACTMNNTMCLAVFMSLVYFKDLEWYYGAEVVSIIFVQWVVGMISLSRTYKVWMGIPVAATYIICLVIVYVLEHQFHWM